MESRTSAKRVQDTPHDSAASVNHRRERGKLAQRAFRQRQIETIQDLKDENKKLRDVIEGISKAATQNHTALCQAIREARGIISIDDGARDTCTPQGFEDIGEQSVVPPKAVDIAQLPVEPSHCTSRSTQNPPRDELQFHQDRGLCGPTEATGLTLGSQHMQQAAPESSQPFSVLDSNLRFEADRHISIVGAPADIVPFLGPMAYTVAGQIHWIAIAYAFSAIRALRKSNPPPDAVATATGVFGLVLRQVPLDDLVTLLHGRLSFRRTGFIAGDYPAFDPAACKTAILSALEKYGSMPKTRPLTAFEVEHRLRVRLGDGFATFEATLSNIDTGCTAIMKRLMTALARQATCYGDGPRWSPDTVTAIADQWIAETRGSSGNTKAT
ncbi:hypothetical protein BJ170DRAFT_606401 [Xylariales sp. AK1849]|nr:hypothetical protein BJ170DRAFT_606401 [Xylariales sp. AK1849]